MEVLWIIANVLLGIMLWDIHRDTKYMAQMAREIAQISKEVSDKTDVILARLPPPAS